MEIDSRFILKTKEEIEKERYDAFKEGPNRHYVELYIQLKRNIDIKTRILEQEQNICELGFGTAAEHLTTSFFLTTLKDEFETSKQMHQSLLEQNFPLQGKYDYSESQQQQKSEAGADQEKKYLQRLESVKQELESSRKEIEDFESRILDLAKEPKSKEVENKLQDLIKDRFLRVNKMLRDVTGKFVE